MSRDKLLAFIFVTLALLPSGLYAQNTSPDASLKVPEKVKEDEVSLKVFVNEVRIPIKAYDENGRFDLTVETQDLMVKEDGIWQPRRLAQTSP